MLFAFLTILLTAAGFLAYEILIMRTLSILNWSHYAYMVVSLAMLGLGFSGVVLAVFAKFFNRWRNEIILAGCFLFSFSIPITFHLNQKLPLNFLYLIWDWRQFIYLGISFLLYGIPFFIVSLLLATFFLCYPQKSGQIYALNLLGSGCGVFFALYLMYAIAPQKYLLFCSILAAAAGLFWGIYYLKGIKKMAVVIFFIVSLFIHCYLSPSSLINYVSQYKGLPQTLRLPETKITSTLYSPLGLINTLSAKTIRLASGLSINFKGELPPEEALTIDADSPSPIINTSKKLESLKFFDESIYSAGYQLIKNPAVLLIGAGGGSDLLLAQYHDSSSITVLEINRQIMEAVKEVKSPLLESLYQSPKFKLIIKEARGYLEETKEKFDLIQLNPSGTLAASSAGVYAQNEDYLNTLESYKLFYDRLTPQGLFMVSVWMKTPARDGIKLFATAFEVLKNSGANLPQNQLALIRNWDIITLLVKKTLFTKSDLKLLERFCKKNNFDICYLPGIKQNQTNLFNKLPQPIYYEAATNIIDPRKKEAFFSNYPFKIQPASDDKPYFSNFFRWKALPHLIKTLGREWIPFTEYGYLVLLATFAQSLIVGGLMILLPLGLLFKGKKIPSVHFKPNTWLYFIALGFSYMLLEMALIQKFILFLHHPIYSVSIVIASFLLLSGCGSLLSKRLLVKSIKYQIIPFIAILFVGLLYSFNLDRIFFFLGWANIYLRFIFSFFIIAPLAFFMGMPFAFGMQKIAETGEENIGRAWGYNGFFSVIGSVATPILAGIIGFKAVGVIGCLGYLAALVTWLRKWR
jgi:hypothetical protein